MPSDDIKFAIEVQSKAYKDSLELFMRDYSARIENLAKQMQSMEKAFGRELREVTNSLQFTQNELDDQKAAVNELKLNLDSKDTEIKDLQAEIKC